MSASADRGLASPTTGVSTTGAGSNATSARLTNPSAASSPRPIRNRVNASRLTYVELADPPALP